MRHRRAESTQVQCTSSSLSHPNIVRLMDNDNIIITIAEGRPLWFKSVPDQYQAGKTVHEYQGGYWEAKESQQWDKCPDIF